VFIGDFHGGSFSGTQQFVQDRWERPGLRATYFISRFPFGTDPFPSFPNAFEPASYLEYNDADLVREAAPQNVKIVTTPLAHESFFFWDSNRIVKAATAASEKVIIAARSPEYTEVIPFVLA